MKTELCYLRMTPVLMMVTMSLIPHLVYLTLHWLTSRLCTPSSQAAS